MKFKTIPCPFCKTGHAYITYEENRVYQLNCPDCGDVIFHKDKSWDAAVEFFERKMISDDWIPATVQSRKPLEAFLHPIDTYDGLNAKYLVFKADSGEKVESCFVLRPHKDPAAVKSLRSYANATENKNLADDIYNWVGKPETNADRIRAMSDEELTEFINTFNICDIRTREECKISYCGVCQVCVLDWLQQPAEQPTADPEEDKQYSGLIEEA